MNDNVYTMLTQSPSKDTFSWKMFAKERKRSKMLVSLGLDNGGDQDESHSEALNKASKNRSFNPGESNASGQNPVKRRLRSMTVKRIH